MRPEPRLRASHCIQRGRDAAEHAVHPARHQQHPAGLIEAAAGGGSLLAEAVQTELEAAVAASAAAAAKGPRADWECDEAGDKKMLRVCRHMSEARTL